MDLGFGDVGLIAFAIIGVVLLLPLVVGGVFVILIVSNRADPDPTGRRPAIVYGYAVSFITLFVSVFASEVIVMRLCSLIGSHSSGISGFEDSNAYPGTFVAVHAGPSHAYGDAVARGVVIGALLLLVAYAMYVAHVRVADRATGGLAPADPAGRVRASYLAAVSFVSVMIVVVSAVAAAYQVFRIVAPGVFNPGGHGSHVRPFGILIPLLYLAFVGYQLLRRHVGQLPPELRPRLGSAIHRASPSEPTETGS